LRLQHFYGHVESVGEEVDNFVNEQNSEVVKFSAFAKLTTPYHNRHLEAEAAHGALC
jgi:hypothetical protein